MLFAQVPVNLDTPMGPPMKLDPALIAALSIEPENTKLHPHGHSGFTTSAKISTSRGGVPVELFLKTGPNSEMFSSEHSSLNTIHAIVPSLCPASLAHGLLSSSQNSSFLVTEFLDVSNAGRNVTNIFTLAQKLSKLHTTPAPVPDGFETPMYGFPVTTFCGSTPQTNTYKSSWADFYAENRLIAISDIIQSAQGADNELRTLIDRTVSGIVPRLLSPGHLGGAAGIVPVLVHGDLWSGNSARGRIAGKGEVEEVIFDPSSCYAHSEYELGIMRMFGGFGKKFFDEYHQLVPKTDPKEEYEDRIDLYELYHHLNHYAIFGGGYRGSAMNIMKRLARKYQTN